MEIVQGKRIYLRPLAHEDVTDAYLEWFRDGDVTDHLVAKNLKKEECIAYMDEGRSSGLYYMYAIVWNENNLHIGNVKVGPINLLDRVSDLVTVVGDKNYWGKAIGTEAIILGNKLAFEKYDIRKLSGGMFASNIKSILAYQKAGWVVEGRLQGHNLHDGKVEDRVLVSCFNPKYFPTFG